MAREIRERCFEAVNTRRSNQRYVRIYVFRSVEWSTVLICCHGMFIFFFFQAEDGIRDYKVTGVQTCALPICQLLPGGRLRRSPRYDRVVITVSYAVRLEVAHGEIGAAYPSAVE